MFYCKIETWTILGMTAYFGPSVEDLMKRDGREKDSVSSITAPTPTVYIIYTSKYIWYT